MSLRVDLPDLAAAIADHDYAYLLTVNDEGRVHAVSITPVLSGGELRLAGLGHRSVANGSARPSVSMVFPPREAHGYSLIVDGDATIDGETMIVAPTTAVRHRPVPPAGEAPSGCGSDCGPVDLSAR